MGLDQRLSQTKSLERTKSVSEAVVPIKEIVALSKTLADITKENGMSTDPFWGTRSSRGIFEVKTLWDAWDQEMGHRMEKASLASEFSLLGNKMNVFTHPL
jgi:hypothetical protein